MNAEAYKALESMPGMKPESEDEEAEEMGELTDEHMMLAEEMGLDKTKAQALYDFIRLCK